MNEQYPLLYESCKIVRGAKNIIIMDLQRNKYYPISSEIIELLEHCDGDKTVLDIKKQYNHQYDAIIEENLNFFATNEILFFTENPEWFPSISTEWDNPSLITNSIVDISPTTIENMDKIIEQLEETGCQFIQFRFYDSCTKETLQQILAPIKNKNILSVELLLKYNPQISTQDLNEVMLAFPRIFYIVVHSAEVNQKIFDDQHGRSIFLNTKKITSDLCCGEISPDYFTTNMAFYTESLQFNSCLNRKISVDKQGLIKNCPSMSEDYGHIAEMNMMTIARSKSFQKYDKINHDMIHKCKDCEFRYMCSDCRAFTENPADIYSAPLKCHYDPYNGVWEKSA